MMYNFESHRVRRQMDILLRKRRRRDTMPRRQGPYTGASHGRCASRAQSPYAIGKYRKHRRGQEIAEVTKEAGAPVAPLLQDTARRVIHLPWQAMKCTSEHCTRACSAEAPAALCPVLKALAVHANTQTCPQASFIRAILQWGGGSGWMGLQPGGWV